MWGHCSGLADRECGDPLPDQIWQGRRPPAPHTPCKVSKPFLCLTPADPLNRQETGAGTTLASSERVGARMWSVPGDMSLPEAQDS